MGKLLIKISPDGSETEIKVEGVVGEGCETLTEDLETAIFQAGTIGNERTPEYYQEDVSVITNKI